MEEKVYSLAEFRKRTREVFNAADNDDTVIIERFNEKYVLVPKTYYDYLLSDEAAITTVEEIEKEKIKPKYVANDQGGQSRIYDAIKTCKHGSAVGLCKFGCKS